MRLRNIKNASDIVSESPLVIKDKYFNSDKPLHIEIGCGKGDFIIGMSKKYPNINFIGIEKYESILVRALQKVEEIPDNLRFMCMDASNLNDIFKSDVDAIYLNFSDPWPKKRHAKRRLTSPSFLSIYEKISNTNVEIYQKTDNKDLFAYSLIQLNNSNYTFDEISLDLINSLIPNIMTEYEKKFTKMGVPINYLHAIKKISK